MPAGGHEEVARACHCECLTGLWPVACRLSRSRAASGKYCITAGYDRSVKLWNPYRSEPGEDDVTGSPLLVQTFKGPHGHPVLDVVMYAPSPELVCLT